MQGAKPLCDLFKPVRHDLELHGVHQRVDLLHLRIFQRLGIDQHFFIGKRLVGIGRPRQRILFDRGAHLGLLRAHRFAQVGLFHL